MPLASTLRVRMRARLVTPPSTLISLVTRPVMRIILVRFLRVKVPSYLVLLTRMVEVITVKITLRVCVRIMRLVFIRMVCRRSKILLLVTLPLKSLRSAAMACLTCLTRFLNKLRSLFGLTKQLLTCVRSLLNASGEPLASFWQALTSEKLAETSSRAQHTVSPPVSGPAA